MKTYNVKFEDVPDVLEDDIRRYLNIRLGDSKIIEYDTSYKISFKNDCLSLYADEQSILTENQKWNEMIYYIPKKKDTHFIATTSKYSMISTYLSLKMGCHSWPGHLIDHFIHIFKEKNVILIGDNITDYTMLNHIANSVNVYTTNQPKYCNSLKYFNKIYIMTPKLSQELYYLNNIHEMDISVLIVNTIFNHFFGV